MEEKNIDELTKLNKIVNNLDCGHHKKIFNIIKSNNVKFSENRNGVFINLNQISKKTIKEIKVYIDYLKIQEKNISNFENIKKEFKKDFFTNNKKEDKDKIMINDKESINEIQNA
jgi:hypothetical protein